MFITKYLLGAILILINFNTISANIDNLSNSDQVNYTIAVVDMTYILQNSLAVKDLTAKIDLIKKNIHDEISQKELNLQKEGDNLIKSIKKIQQNSQESRDFDKKVFEIKKNVQQKQIKLQKVYTDGIHKINGEIIAIIKNICSDKKCKVVLPSSNIIYSDESLNISAEVLKKLDQKISSIDVGSL